MKSAPARQFFVRLGHDLVWLFIAALFCAVEAVVLVTEFKPARLARVRGARRTGPSSALRPNPAGSSTVSF